MIIIVKMKKQIIRKKRNNCLINLEKDLVVNHEQYDYVNVDGNNLAKSFVSSTLITNCFLNNLSFDQIGQFSFSAKEKKSMSSINSLYSFLENPFAKCIAFLNCSLYSANGTNFTYECNSNNTDSNSFFVNFDLFCNTSKFNKIIYTHNYFDISIIY